MSHSRTVASSDEVKNVLLVCWQRPIKLPLCAIFIISYLTFSLNEGKRRLVPLSLFIHFRFLVCLYVKILYLVLIYDIQIIR
jgi:hypothetical protein